jgi:glycosyltransferase involved in cell wall biosynthesis
MRRIALDWQISSCFGWGVYALNMALECAKHPDIELSANIRSLDDIVVDNLRKRALAPFIARSMRGDRDGAVVIEALGNDGLRLDESVPPAQIAAIFFEEPLSKAGIERLKRYETIIAGSSWNADILRDAGINVRLAIQGVDRSLFHPAHKRSLFPDRFLIFSGGKAEPRKGQDIVVKAFRIFARKYADAMLVTAWSSPWPHLAKGMDLDLSEFGDRVIDVGSVPNGQMGPIYRECDVAVFPNRAEGGTNLVAMECLACGVPCIVSATTGHLDLFDLAEPIWLNCPNGEPSLEGILNNLEDCYAHTPRDMPHSLPLWSDTAKVLIETVI